MAGQNRLRAVYKSIGEQDIDTDVYLPPQGHGNEHDYPCPVVIDIHGGAFMLGSSRMVNMDQIQDCLGRGWIVLAPNHRLCPQVDLLQGPITDCRDLLEWVHSGGLQEFIDSNEAPGCAVDLDHVFAFGTSSGGTLALSLGYGVPHPVAGIYDMYGPCNFTDSFWTTPLPHVAEKLPPNLTEDFTNEVFDEQPVPIAEGVSLEGQTPGRPDFSSPRPAYAMTQIANGTVLNAIFPSGKWDDVDPLRNISQNFPPTFIVHGTDDSMVPIHLSRSLYRALQEHRVKSDMREIPNEEHTFAARMKLGSPTWNIQREGLDFLESLIHRKTRNST